MKTLREIIDEQGEAVNYKGILPGFVGINREGDYRFIHMFLKTTVITSPLSDIDNIAIRKTEPFENISVWPQDVLWLAKTRTNNNVENQEES